MCTSNDGNKHTLFLNHKHFSSISVVDVAILFHCQFYTIIWIIIHSTKCVSRIQTNQIQWLQACPWNTLSTGLSYVGVMAMCFGKKNMYKSTMAKIMSSQDPALVTGGNMATLGHIVLVIGL